MAKTFETENSLPNIVGTGTKFTGDIETNGDLRVDGTIDGNVISKGKLVLGANGNIKGTVKCGSAEVSGKFDGKMEVSELLSLKSTALFKGEMTVNKLSIEPGATFIGNCHMAEKGQPTQPEANKK